MRENYNSGEKIKTPTRYVLSLQKALSCFIQIMLFPLELNAIQFENIPSRPASKGSRARVVPHRIAGKAIPDAVPGICSATWCSSKEPAMTWLDSRWNNAVRHGTRHEFHFNSLKKHIEKKLVANWTLSILRGNFFCFRAASTPKVLYRHANIPNVSSWNVFKVHEAQLHAVPYLQPL
jgi:hypothetical protein